MLCPELPYEWALRGQAGPSSGCHRAGISTGLLQADLQPK